MIVDTKGYQMSYAERISDSLLSFSRAEEMVQAVLLKIAFDMA